MMENKLWIDLFLYLFKQAGRHAIIVTTLMFLQFAPSSSRFRTVPMAMTDF
jgi:hypothetical protein